MPGLKFYLYCVQMIFYARLEIITRNHFYREPQQPNCDPQNDSPLSNRRQVKAQNIGFCTNKGLACRVTRLRFADYRQYGLFF